MILAVQEERQKSGMSGEGESPSSPGASVGSGSTNTNMGIGSSGSNNDDEMLIEKLIAAELSVEPKIDSFHEEECSYDRLLSTTNSQLAQLTDWAKRVPHFATLSLDDQVALVRASWRDILCCSLAYRSIMAPDCGLILSVSFVWKLFFLSEKNPNVYFDIIKSEGPISYCFMYEVVFEGELVDKVELHLLMLSRWENEKKTLAQYFNCFTYIGWFICSTSYCS